MASVCASLGIIRGHAPEQLATALSVGWPSAELSVSCWSSSGRAGAACVLRVRSWCDRRQDPNAATI